jgi:hypothetical protein
VYPLCSSRPGDSENILVMGVSLTGAELRTLEILAGKSIPKKSSDRKTDARFGISDPDLLSVKSLSIFSHFGPGCLDLEIYSLLDHPLALGLA